MSCGGHRRLASDADGHTPMATPAHSAAPSDVASVTGARWTGRPVKVETLSSNSRLAAAPRPAGSAGGGSPAGDVDHPAGADGDLGVTLVHAALSHEAGLLVAHERGHRDTRPLTAHTRRRHHARQARGRDLEGVQHFAVP